MRKVRAPQGRAVVNNNCSSIEANKESATENRLFLIIRNKGEKVR